ncbi:uncharacterized protein LOC115797052 [Archocentrus centrarchus]|uniref:uncharacterized protein LOC115797052 n=1 Tax=Archocentrus centrarchus TaxID=63155 RepID=UPI0011EA303C|nr:uncharacterized protein LOC115797052 [Archocentrus centrarchus]
MAPKPLLLKFGDLLIDIDSSPISPSSYVHDLGVVLDSMLSFKNHIKSVTKTAFYHLMNICRLQPVLTDSIAETLIRAFFTTLLDYCNWVFFGISDKALDRLQYVQNSAASLLTRTKVWQHNTPTFIKLHWLPVKSRIVYKILLFTYNSLSALAPQYLSDFLHPYKQPWTIWSSAMGLLFVPRANLHTFGDRAFNAVLTIEPNCSSFFIGEFVTIMCGMNEGADTDWEYKLNKDGREFVPYNTHKDYRIKISSTGYSGEYQCSGRRKSSRYTKRSNTVSVTVSAGKPRATLTAGTTIIPVGGSVILTCSVGRSDEWKYEWFRRTQRTTEVQIRRDDQQNRVFRVSQGGIYRCRGGRGDPVFNTYQSDEVSIKITFSNKVAVKQQQHNWTQIFSGETITLTCEVEEGGEPTEWEYEWRGPWRTTQWRNNYLTFRVSESTSGDYMCKSRRRDDSYSSTEWSEAFTLSASTDKPRATLTAGTTIIPVGGSVTLTCSAGRSDEWKYEWFRRTEITSEVQIRRDDQPNRVIRVSQGGIYSCRGRRGYPVYYTDISAEVIIEITFSNKVAVKQQQHNWTQIFSGETITLTCEVQEGGEPTEWEYGWRGPRKTTQWTHNNSWIFNISESSSGDYTCKSRRRDDSYSSTKWSEAFTVSASSKSWGGLESFSFLVPLIIGLVCGILLILLRLLCHFKLAKGSSSISGTQSTNQSSATNHMINQDEAQHNQHTSPLQGDACLFKSIKDHNDTENGDSRLCGQSTASYNQAKASGDKEKSDPAAADETIYSDIKLRTALDNSLSCTQVIYNQAKTKTDKGKLAPAAADETALDDVLYAQVFYNKTECKNDKD